MGQHQFGLENEHLIICFKHSEGNHASMMDQPFIRTQFVVFNELLTLSSSEEVMVDLHIREEKKNKEEPPNEEVMLKPAWVRKRIIF